MCYRTTDLTLSHLELKPNCPSLKLNSATWHQTSHLSSLYLSVLVCEIRVSDPIHSLEQRGLRVGASNLLESRNCQTAHGINGHSNNFEGVICHGLLGNSACLAHPRVLRSEMTFPKLFKRLTVYQRLRWWFFISVPFHPLSLHHPNGMLGSLGLRSFSLSLKIHLLEYQSPCWEASELTAQPRLLDVLSLTFGSASSRCRSLAWLLQDPDSSGNLHSAMSWNSLSLLTLLCCSRHLATTLYLWEPWALSNSPPWQLCKSHVEAHTQTIFKLCPWGLDEGENRRSECRNTTATP